MGARMNLRFFAAFFSLFVSLTAGASQPTLQAQKLALESFYRNYLDNLGSPSSLEEGALLFSQSLRDLIQKHDATCPKDEVCAWGSAGDPFLDAQDYGDDLKFANSQFSIREVAGDNQTVFEVTFTLDPKDNDSYYARTIQYIARPEGNGWAIDDMVYLNGGTERSLRSELSK